MRAWKVQTFGTERQYRGNLGYSDEPQSLYQADSEVPNAGSIRPGDLLFVEDTQGLLGVTRVAAPLRRPGRKTRLRCPLCNNTNLKVRRTKSPPYRCDFKHEFDHPIEEIVDCTEILFLFEGFVPTPGALSRQALRASCPRYNERLSIQAVALERIAPALLSAAPQAAHVLDAAAPNEPRAVTNATQVAALNDTLLRAFEAVGEPLGSMRLGYRGGEHTAEIIKVVSLGIWLGYGVVGNRYWNALGVGDPERLADRTIVVEINFPRGSDEPNAAIGGLFAIRADAGPLLCHRGKVGGGREGIGRKTFLASYRGAVAEVQGAAGRDRRAVVIGRLEDEKLPAYVASFVHAVHRYKSTPVEAAGPVSRYRPEFIGTKAVPARDEFFARCTHGAVVEQLRIELERRGLRVANDTHRDLIAHGPGGAEALFEVKTADDLYAAYQAVGQLYYHSGNGHHMYAVLPVDLARRVEARLAQLKVGTIGYTWEGLQVRFDSLPDLER